MTTQWLFPYRPTVHGLKRAKFPWKVALFSSLASSHRLPGCHPLLLMRVVPNIITVVGEVILSGIAFCSITRSRNFLSPPLIVNLNEFWFLKFLPRWSGKNKIIKWWSKNVDDRTLLRKVKPDEYRSRGFRCVTIFVSFSRLIICSRNIQTFVNVLGQGLALPLLAFPPKAADSRALQPQLPILITH